MNKLPFLLYAKLRQHRVKVDQARGRVAEWLDNVRHPYVAFSTGKDSTCVLHLVRSQMPRVPAVYLDADASFPETLSLLNYTEGVVVYRTPETIFDILRKFPTLSDDRIGNEMVRVLVRLTIGSLMADYHFDGVAYGLRMDENRQRRKHGQMRGPVFQYRSGAWGCQPILDWTFNDVWAYIFSNGIPYCAVYDRLFKLGVPPEDCRLSYWAGETKRRWGRWAILKRGWPELFNRFAAEFPEVRSYV